MALVHTIFDPIGITILTMLAVLLFILENQFPLRRRVQPRWRRLIVNVVFSLPSLALARLALIPALVWVATKNIHWDIGFVHWLPLPTWTAFAAGFLILDYSLYLWHRMMHQWPFFWRFHAVHHTDLDLDLSTAIRFHFGEMLLSIPGRGVFVLLTGASPALVLVYEICFEAATSFQHSNWRVPLPVDKLLNLLIVTPRMHGIHHSVLKKQRDTNYSTIFSFWDRLHRTLRMDIPQENLGIGIETHPEMLSILSLLLLPFRKRYETR